MRGINQPEPSAGYNYETHVILGTSEEGRKSDGRPHGFYYLGEFFERT